MLQLGLPETIRIVFRRRSRCETQRAATIGLSSWAVFTTGIGWGVMDRFFLRAACHGAWVFRVLCFFVSYSFMLCANAFMHVTVHEGVALCIMLCM